ncbi:hypothetical protein BD779DRAFT_1499491 [Infundibulicybe gibba]|nr:hypothetical protein BD779DRAFT_1499491 [Infundibulicybe gibba]
MAPTSRATSPNLLPFRFGGQPDSQFLHRKSIRDSKASDFFSTERMRRSSTHRAKDKGKSPVMGGDSASPSSNNFAERDPFASNYAASSYSSYDSSRPSTTDGTPPILKKSRGSLLTAASDALGLKFGRRRPSIRQPPMPIILSDVIEITAARPDAEQEERERLRGLAAKSIGIDTVMMTPEPQTQEDSLEEEDGKGSQEPDPESTWETLHGRTLDPAPSMGKVSPHNSTVSISITTQPFPGRHRSGSMLAHSRKNSSTLAPVPSFPSSPSALLQFQQSASTLPKFYPPSSLRIFALSKNWKTRYMILSSPTALPTRGSGPPVSYLHLFKSPGSDERELERLEINEESVIFVSEEEVGGRKHVVKVGGLDVGAMKKELNHEEGGRAMWFLQITNPAEAQKWITTIKTAIFGQRTMRAGLGPVNALLGTEPRGDMDVMLSMRTQGLISSPTSNTARSIHNTPSQSAAQPDRNYASSVSSHSIRSQVTTPKTPPTGAVSTLKGLFTGGRPRSASRATSIDSDRQQGDRETGEDSFASMGGNLLRPPTSLGPPRPTITHATLPFSGPVGERRLERKIIPERHPIHWTPHDVPQNNVKDRANRALSLGALSLQPPPRKRWTSIEPSTTIETTSEAHHHANASVLIASHESAGTEPPVSPSLSGFSFGTPEHRPRAPSLQSVSTLASGENGMGLERSSSSTKRTSGTNRWSRQLPQRLTPPSGPPPVPPVASGSHLEPHPYAGRPPSRTSSHNSGTSQRSMVSSLPSFSKRASGSSAFSVNTFSTSHSHTNGHAASRPTSSHRMSIPPPPRPPPSFALPPAPDQETSKSDHIPGKLSFRDSVAQRAFRLSMIAPKPPPSTILPPCPVDPEYNGLHRRSLSSGSNHPTPPNSISSISTSLAPQPLTVSPFPPPLGPLPPTPGPPSPPASQMSHRTSIKHRLRILSTPSPAGNGNGNGNRLSRARPTTMTLMQPPITISQPATPIAEKITQFQNDPSFLLFTPVTPPTPPPGTPPTSPRFEEYNEPTSLLPPPRRSSKQISVLGPEVEDTETLHDKAPEGLLSLSRPGSVISLGIMSM